jgi:hypothetical protein
MQIAKCKLQIERPAYSLSWLNHRLRLPLVFVPNLQFAICNLQFAILLLVGFLATGSRYVLGADPPADAEAPLVGRKEPFCGAVGAGRFQVSTTASPKSVQAGDPINLTIRIQASGAWMRAPERPDLQHKPEYAKFRESFHIDNGSERLSSGEGKWEFDFVLRPKSEKVREIPSLVVVYYRPGFTPPEKGFMTTRAPAIPVQVSSRAKVQASEIRGQSASRATPDQLYEIITGPGVLAHEEPVVIPKAWVFILLALAPPVLSIGWYRVWRRWNPTQARLSRMRKSRAARQALQALKPTHHREPKEEAREAANVLAGYLQERLDLSATQPAPEEIAAHLLSKEIPVLLANRTADFFRECDAIRFGPPRQGSSPLRQQGIQLNGLQAEAAELVLALESQP